MSRSSNSIEGIPLITRFKTPRVVAVLDCAVGIEGIPLITRFKTIYLYFFLSAS